MLEKDIVEARPQFISPSFNGGMVRILDPTNLEANQYHLLVNGRSRYGKIKSVKKPYDFTAENEIPSGNYQGVYSVDSSLVVFIGGTAYRKEYNVSLSVTPSFYSVPDWQTMDGSVDTIWAALVPSSYSDLKRTLRSAGDERDIKLGDISGSSPACLVCQDGINQPRLILSNGSSRISNDIEAWKKDPNDPFLDNREYVPIGKQMMYHPDGKLYIVNGNKIYHSVTGRPLDFVIAIDSNGDRLLPVPSGGEADRLSHKVTYQNLTAIFPLPSKVISDELTSTFLVGTEKDTYMVIPNFSQLIYGEPKFRNIHLFESGPFNQFSVSNLLNDTVFVDFTGIKSFSAIDRFSEQGENSTFSKNVHDLFEDIEQTVTATAKFDNYAYFAVRTTKGPGIIIYDELLQSFVGLDIFDNVIGSIKQFASIISNGIRKLFFITESNLYEYQGGTETALTQLYTKEWFFGRSEVEHKPVKINLIFRNIRSSGTVSVTEYVDRQPGDKRSRSITFEDATGSVSVSPEPIPFATDPNEKKGNITFTLPSSKRGLVSGVFVEFDFKAELKQVEVITDEHVQLVGSDQASRNY